MKRWLLLLILALPVVGSAQGRSSGVYWTCSVDNVADSDTACIEAPEPGMRRYVTDIVAQSTTATAGLFNLYYGTGLNCVTGETKLFPPIGNNATFAAAGNADMPTLAVLATPIIVPGGKALCVLGDPSNAVTVQISGYLAP